MTNADQLALLITTLAAWESPWLPVRRHWDRAAAIHARRRGEVWDLSSDKNYTRRSRQRATLVDRGLLDGSYRLTEIGRRFVRSLVWPFTQAELRTALIRLCDAVDRGDYLEHGVLLVPEQIIAGEIWGRQVGWTQGLFLPLLADRVLGSMSTPDGRVYYHLRGDTDLASVVASIVKDDVGLNERACEVYDREFRRCRDRMLTDTRYFSELGETPIPARELASGRDDNDLTGISPLFPNQERRRPCPERKPLPRRSRRTKA
jgi:hypothetical protein